MTINQHGDKLKKAVGVFPLSKNMTNDPKVIKVYPKRIILEKHMHKVVIIKLR
jgi:hypothetical protein